MLRHPVDVSVSLFHYLGTAEWEGTYREEFRNMTLLEYATTDRDGVRIDNWMTRYLARKIKGDLEEEDIKLAKDILERKCLIGMTDEFIESFRRFNLFFGLGKWLEDGLPCVEKYMNNRANKNSHQKVKHGSDEWVALAQANKIDIELFNFGKDLWKRQGEMLAHRHADEWNFRQGS